ncbi:MAG: toprim domain-containing protein [Candidatus Aenigmarchaeota archaeon]|nr:toprim domain-containing protein [Candidatus Aenigmarchaeota archaeon]
MNRLSNLERVRRFLRVISLGKFVAIVEGKRDKEALKLFGFDNIIEIGRTSIFSLKLNRRSKFVILTDFDEEGRKKAKKLLLFLKKNGFDVDEEIRREFFKIFKVRKIEEVGSLVKKLFHS